jgi:Peptidase family M23/D-alanyl-D-alanine carboxypeptidase
MAAPAILIAGAKMIGKKIATQAASTAANKVKNAGKGQGGDPNEKGSGNWWKVSLVIIALFGLLVTGIFSGIMGLASLVNWAPDKSLCVIFPDGGGDAVWGADVDTTGETVPTSDPTGIYQVPTDSLNTDTGAGGLASAADGVGSVVVPLPAGTYRVSSSYGPRVPPVKGASSWHKGTDFPAPQGTPVFATAPGVVTVVTVDKNKTNIIQIQHKFGDKIYTSAYLHLYSMSATVGQVVNAGDVIGTVGSTGLSSGNHLHFEIWTGTSVGGSNHNNPTTWLEQQGARVISEGLQVDPDLEGVYGPPLPDASADACQAPSAGGSGGSYGGDGRNGWGGHSNGEIPDEELTTISFAPGQRLRGDAVAALEKMNVAFKAHFGYDIGITDSYRSLEGQKECTRTKGNLCATPGKSNHGWGLALDLKTGINRFGSPEHVWMTQNANKYGWIHPDWAQANGSKPEAWHWEYLGGVEGEGGDSGGKDANSARIIARGLLPSYGWDTDGTSKQFVCLNNLWEKESNWNYQADNPSSSAYGIPQALPGNKMATVGADWRTNPKTQIIWGLGYIQGRYGEPCKAWAHSQQKNWY